MPLRRAVLAVPALLALAAGCGGSVTALDRPAASEQPTVGAEVVSVPGAQLLTDIRVELAPVEPWPPGSAVEAFRAFEAECSRYATLAGNIDPDRPRVEPDRFAGAVAVRDLAPGTTLVVDGRGTRLVVAAWNRQPVLLAASGRPGDPLPEPYRLGCGPEPTFQQPAPGG